MNRGARRIILTAISLVFAALSFRHIEAAANVNDLIKASGSSVYYLGIDNRRYVFPNEKIYFSWYKDFSGVKTISDQEMASYQIGGNVTYKPGVRLIKIQTVPKVYAVSAGGVLRWVPDETAAAAIYGADWKKSVDDLPDSFFLNYTIGSDISPSKRYDRDQEIANATSIGIDKRIRANADGSQNINLNVPTNTVNPVSGGGGGGGGLPAAAGDTSAPTISAFSVPSTNTSLAVTISSFTASDNVGVTGYLITETAATPNAGATSWLSIAPTSYTFSSQGSKTLYAWAKDAAGNVSASSSDTTTITLPSAAKSITAFNFNGLSPAVNGTVNEGGHTITLTVPHGTDVTALVPTIITTGVSVSPNSGVAKNFTNPQTYTVTAEDGSTQNYTVTVTVAANSGTAAVVLYTDIASGPITGGENNKGIYLSVFGKNFGASSDMGVNTKVYIGGVEVDNYRYLGTSKVQSALGIQQITVQVGGLGNPALGVALPINVKVNGVDSNSGVTFTPNPGKIYFVSNISGNDATGAANDINRPYRNVQKATISNNGDDGCPILSGDQTVGEAGVWGLVHPGDFIVMRGGTWTDLSKDNFFMRIQNKSGTAPTGALNSGPISLIGYPTEDVFINMDPNVNSLVGGGISSADTARQEIGCGAWVTVANIRLESGGREGMITTQAGHANPAGSHWRVVNNELSAATVNGELPAKGAGVAGSGIGGFYYGNYIHDVHGGIPERENHGFYIDGSGSYDIAYNWIKDIPGGNGINIYGSSGTNPSNIDFHHNIINNVGKHGLNIGDGATHDLNFYDNLIYNISNYCLRFNTNELSGNGVKVWNNTFYNCGTVRDDFGYNAVIANTWDDLSPTFAKLYNNIFVANRSSIDFIGGAAVGALNSNLYFGSADATSYANDAHPVTSNPLFTSTTPGAENLRLQAASPAIDAGTALVSSLIQYKRDLSLDVFRPQGSAYDIGAYETP